MGILHINDGNRPQILRRIADGTMVRVLPAIAIDAAFAHDPRWLLAAAATRYPRAVFVGSSAAMLTFRPDAAPPVHVMAGPRLHVSRPWLRSLQRRIPSDHAIHSVLQLGSQRFTITHTDVPLTLLDLARNEGSEPLFDALRRGLTTPAQLMAVVRDDRWRPGNQSTREVVDSLGTNPWSPAELIAHLLMGDAGLTGWTANRAVACGNLTYICDVVFDKGLIVEIDGFEHHSSRAAFEADRARQNDLVDHGWVVLRFTWRDVTERPEYVVDRIRRRLAALA